MKVSEWLDEHGSHSIYISEELRQDFTKRVGSPHPAAAGWPEYSETITRTTMEHRGLGGELGDAQGQKLAYGYSVAVHLARTLIPGFKSTKQGRGFAFHEALDALREAGL